MDIYRPFRVFKQADGTPTEVHFAVIVSVPIGSDPREIAFPEHRSHVTLASDPGTTWWLSIVVWEFRPVAGHDELLYILARAAVVDSFIDDERTFGEIVVTITNTGGEEDTVAMTLSEAEVEEV